MRTLVQDLLARFRRDERANAAVEFALIVPFMIALYLGSLEASALFTADKRVNSISATVGDLVGQWNPDDGTISATTLNGYFAAAQGLISPYASAGVNQVLSLVYVKADGTTKVLWSKANGTGAVARAVGSSFAPLTTAGTAMMNTISRSGCVIASETSYAYKPLLGQVFKTTLNLAHTNYFIPRYGATDVIQVATPGISTTSCVSGS